jgi:putative ATP-dependent endonuclease of OLD family
LAKLLDRPFTKYGVSVVNVGHRGYFRYSRIFQRKDGTVSPIQIACIVDKDIPPEEARHGMLHGYVPAPKRGKRFGRDFNPGEMVEYESNLLQHRGGGVEVFVSPQWTLEHDLALTGLGRELHQAVALACEHKNIGILSEEERQKVFEAARTEFDGFEGQLSPAEVAVRVYEPLYERRASKAETAQILADILDPKTLHQQSESPATKLSASELKAKLPDYLVKAIEHVTEKIPGSISNASAT